MNSHVWTGSQRSYDFAFEKDIPGLTQIFNASCLERPPGAVVIPGGGPIVSFPGIGLDELEVHFKPGQRGKLNEGPNTYRVVKYENEPDQRPDILIHTTITSHPIKTQERYPNPTMVVTTDYVLLWISLIMDFLKYFPQAGEDFLKKLIIQAVSLKRLVVCLANRLSHVVV